MKNQLLCWVLKSLFLLISLSVYSQKDKVNIPELDKDDETYTLEFSNDSEYENVISAYMEGKTEKDSLRFHAIGTTFPQRVVVTVITEDIENIVKVNIVKKHWKDFRRGGETKNGLYQGYFDTVGEFGIIISSAKPEVPFKIAVWTTGEIIPENESLFYPISNSDNNPTNVSLASDNMILAEIGNGKSNLLMYILISVLIIIAVLLLFILLKKKNKATFLLILLLSTTGSIYADAWNISATGFSRGRIPANIKFDDIVKGLEYLEKARSFSEALKDWLHEDDASDQPEMDPADQPQLPSSCIQSYRGKDIPGSGGSGSSHSNNNQSDSNSDDYESNADSNMSTDNDLKDGKYSNNGSNNVINIPVTPAGEGFDNSKQPNPNGESNPPPDRGPGLQLPRYDQNGQLIDSGDFPDAPSHISTSGKERTRNPYLDNGTGSTQSKPTYDSNGHLKYPDEFPDAPEKIDVSTGFPPMLPTLQGQEQQGSHSVKQPVYDKNGTLIDAGDYPNAPPKINPRKIDVNTNSDNNSPEEGSFGRGSSIGGLSSSTSGGNAESFSSGGINTSGSNSNSGSGSNSTVSGNGRLPGTNNSNGSGGGGRIGPPNGNNGSNADNSAGCECLKNAYARLEDRRILFERLRIITARMERQVGFGLSFGDNVAGIHGVLGVVWQSQRYKILEGLQKFDKTYENKYYEMVADLYEILLEIDKCEAMLGYENWYNHSGFIYYTYMKDRYKRVKSI